MHILELINQRINSAAVNGKSEVLASLVELKSAIGNQEQSRPIYLTLAEDRDAALAEVARLRVQLAHEDNFSASMLDMRNQAEDERDKLKLRLKQLQSSLTRPEPSRLEIAAMMVASGYTVKAALREADTLIAEARKEVAK